MKMKIDRKVITLMLDKYRASSKWKGCDPYYDIRTLYKFFRILDDENAVLKKRIKETDVSLSQNRQCLFDYMSQEYNILLFDSSINEIEQIVFSKLKEEVDKRKDWLPLSEGSPCKTTHYACDCMNKVIEELRNEIGELKHDNCCYKNRETICKRQNTELKAEVESYKVLNEEQITEHNVLLCDIDKLQTQLDKVEKERDVLATEA